mmetsp:Transcript_1390/g.3601  ORF Transcript_1390/g.3601 Transcript_1390/m.3601 type:complete len:280 (+) Transcript_1390:371-1210(+)
MRPLRTPGHGHEVVKVPSRLVAARPPLATIVEDGRLLVVSARHRPVLVHIVIALAPIVPAPRHSWWQVRGRFWFGRLGGRFGCRCRRRSRGRNLGGSLHAHHTLGDARRLLLHSIVCLLRLARRCGRVAAEHATWHREERVKVVNFVLFAARPPLARVVEDRCARVVAACILRIVLLSELLLASVILASGQRRSGTQAPSRTGIAGSPHDPHFLALSERLPHQRVACNRLPWHSSKWRCILHTQLPLITHERRLRVLLVVRRHVRIQQLVGGKLQPLVG